MPLLLRLWIKGRLSSYGTKRVKRVFKSRMIDLLSLGVVLIESDRCLIDLLWCHESWARVIAYANKEIYSLCLKEHKILHNSYHTHDIELEVIYAIMIWRHYFYGLHVDIFTDHKRLQYLFTHKHINLYLIRLL